MGDMPKEMSVMTRAKGRKQRKLEDVLGKERVAKLHSLPGYDELETAEDEFAAAVASGRIPSKDVIKAIFEDEDAGYYAAQSPEYAKRMLPLAHLSKEQRQEVYDSYHSGIDGWMKCLDGAGMISTSFAVYLHVKAILENRGKDFRFTPAFIAAMQVDCNLGGYYGATAAMIKRKVKEACSAA